MYITALCSSETLVAVPSTCDDAMMPALHDQCLNDDIFCQAGAIGANKRGGNNATVVVFDSKIGEYRVSVHYIVSTVK